MELRGRLAVVTGASSGIGAVAALALAARGARVLLLARTQSKLEEVAQRVRAAGGEAFVYAVDLSDLTAAQECARRIIAEVGAPNVLVNNAGAGRWLSVEETDPTEAVQMMALPYFAAFALCHVFVPAMVARGSGWVVNITSPAAVTPFGGATGYSAARGAMASLSTSLRAELRGTGVGCSLIIAGKVHTPYFDNNPGSLERLPTLGRLIPTLSAEDVAAAIVRALESERSLFVIPFVLRVFKWMHHLAPGLVQAVMDGTGWKRAASR